MDYIFYMVAEAAKEDLILARYKDDEHKAIILHNWILFNNAADKHGYRVKLVQNGKILTRDDFRIQQVLNRADFNSWKYAIRKILPDCYIEGDKDIAEAFVSSDTHISLGDWDGETGRIFIY